VLSASRDSGRCLRKGLDAASKTDILQTDWETCLWIHRDEGNPSSARQIKLNDAVKISNTRLREAGAIAGGGGGS
jgi:hypothetical protein